MKNAMTKKITASVIVLLMSVMAVLIAGCGSKESQLIGQWEVVESNGGTVIHDKINFFGDGTGVLEFAHLALPFSFTWRIDNDRLTLMLSGGMVQMYSIVEISKSTLILEGNIPLSGGTVHVKYSKKSASQTTKAKKEEEPSKANIIPAEPLKDSNNSKKEEKPNKANIILTELLKDSRDGKNYKTVKIGTQTWIAENLNYNASGSKCYNNSESNCQKYGRLYNWATAVNACPSGWQLPSNAEWDALYRFADGTSGTSSPYESETAGKYLKAKNGWNKNGNGEDKFNFEALPGGLGNSDGSFNGIGDFGYWWDASELNAKTAYRRSILHFDERAYWRQGSKSNLLSVRCVKEEKTEAEVEAMEELEREAKKWQKSDCWSPYKSIEGKYFAFKGVARRYTETGACDISWTATSKIKIGNCPAKSVWEMTAWGEEGRAKGENETPAKCKSITPKIITNHNYNEFE